MQQRTQYTCVAAACAAYAHKERRAPQVLAAAAGVRKLRKYLPVCVDIVHASGRLARADPLDHGSWDGKAPLGAALQRARVAKYQAKQAEYRYRALSIEAQEADGGRVEQSV